MMNKLAALAAITMLTACGTFPLDGDEQEQQIPSLSVEWKSEHWRFCDEPACARPTKKTVVLMPAVQKVAPVQQPEPVKPVIRTRVTVNFPFASAVPTKHGEAQIRKAASMVAPGDVLIIEGRTDNVGGGKVNDALAAKRADAVADRLKSIGVKASIEIQGQGLCCYAANNDTEDGRAANRRVEIYFSSNNVTNKEAK